MLKDRIIDNSSKKLRPRTVLADGHPLILDALSRLLEPRLEIVGKASNGLQALQMVRQMLPDLLLLEIAITELDGLAVVSGLQGSVRATKILVLSSHSEASWVRSAFEAGACGYLCKTCSLEEIDAAVSAVLAGQFWISPELVQGAFAPATGQLASRRRAGPPADTLTARESEVLDLLASDFSNKEMALRLGVSVATVRTHLSSIYEKVHLDSRVGLALYASQHRF